MNRNWSNQKPNPALQPKWGIIKIQTNYKENIWPTEWAAISQKVATQQPKPN